MAEVDAQIPVAVTEQQEVAAAEADQAPVVVETTTTVVATTEAPAAAPATADAPAPDAATVNAQVAAAAAEAVARAAALAAQFAAKHEASGDDPSGSNKRKLDSDAYGDDPGAKRHGGEAGLSTMTMLPGGEACDIVQVPHDKIGRLIGRAGATIKVIQERGMTRLKVDHNATGATKPVTITGTPENVALTRRLIAEALEDGGGGLSSQPSHAASGFSAGTVTQVGGETTRKFTCPPTAVGRIIGRGGETIRSIQNASGAHINVNQNFPEGQPREIEIKGRTESVDAAYRMVMDLIGTDGAPNTQNIIQKHGQGAVREVTCPKNMVGRIIGKGGETIKNLQKQFTVSIQVDQSVTPCKVTITGPVTSIAAAERAVLELVEDRPPGGGGYAGSRPGGPGGYSAPGGYGANPYPAQPPAYGGGGGYGGPPPPAYGGGYAPPPYGGAPAAYGAPAPSYGAPPPAAQQAPPAYGGGAGYAGGYAPAPDPYAQGGAYGAAPAASGAAAGGYGAPAQPAQQQGAYGAPQHQHAAYAPQAQASYAPQPPVAPPPQAPARPPSSWSEQKDDQGRVYYYNSQTGVSQWERPHDM